MPIASALIHGWASPGRLNFAIRCSPSSSTSALGCAPPMLVPLLSASLSSGGSGMPSSRLSAASIMSFRGTVSTRGTYSVALAWKSRPPIRLVPESSR